MNFQGGDKENSCSELRKVRMTKTSVIQFTELKTIKQIFITQTKSEICEAAAAATHCHKAYSSSFSQSSASVFSSTSTSSSSSSSQSPETSSAGPSIVNCPICGEKTLNHCHYGGVACHSCKAFFRRTAVSPSVKSQKCRTGKKNCPLKKQRRNNCPYCRFQKCIVNGMDPSLIKIKTGAKAGMGQYQEEMEEDDDEDNTEIEERENPEKIPEILTLNDKMFQILRYHKLILTQTAGVNLMTVPDEFVKLIEKNICMARADSATSKDVLVVAEIEHIFICVKSEFLGDSEVALYNFVQQEPPPSLLFVKVQELMLELAVRFMKGCPHFQSLTWDCKSRLLRKNITEICILLMMLSYERQSSSFKIILTGDTIVNITEESLYNYFSPYVSRDLFEFAANFSLYEIPGHVLVILVIICLYSRDGMLMKKQEKIDTARNYYQQLLFRYTKETSSEDQGSRHNATLHKALKTVKDFGEKIRSFEVLNNQTKINV